MELINEKFNNGPCRARTMGVIYAPVRYPPIRAKRTLGPTSGDVVRIASRLGLIRESHNT